MTQSINLPAAGLLGLGRPAIVSLRDALLRDMGPNAATYLQQAGYAGGDAVYAAFGEWLAAERCPAPEALSLERFGTLSSRFFSELGWGSFTFVSSAPVATIDSPDWAEADTTEPLDQPCCHLGTGILAAFFGRLAEQPLAVMEVECRGAGAPQCRFLLGSAEVMQEVWEGMAAGRDYAEMVNG